MSFPTPTHKSNPPSIKLHVSTIQKSGVLKYCYIFATSGIHLLHDLFYCQQYKKNGPFKTISYTVTITSFVEK